MPDTRQYKDRAEYLKKAVAKRRKKLKRLLVEKKGGQCILCGYRKSVEALDFHHVDGSTKTFGISLNGLTRSWESIQKEAEKCILVCANCHREIHANLVQLPRAIAVEKRGELSPSVQKKTKGIR